MFVWIPIENFSLIFTHLVIIAVEGFQILTYTRHSCPIGTEGSLACHTYCITGHLFNGHLQGPVTLTPVVERLSVELSVPVLSIGRFKIVNNTNFLYNGLETVTKETLVSVPK